MNWLTSSRMRLCVLWAGALLAASVAVLIISEQFDGFTNFGTSLLCAVAIAALIGTVLTWLKRAPVVAVAMNLFAISMTGLFVGGQVLVDMRTVRPLIDTTEQNLSQITQVPRPPINSDEASFELLAALELLDPLRDLHVRGTEIRASGSSLGFIDPDNLSTASTRAYLRGLSDQFLPRLITQLENQITGAPSNSDALYDMFKVYLMLGQQGPMDRDFVLGHLAADFETRFPGPRYEQVRFDLNDHAAQLLLHPFPVVALDGNLVDRTQQTLAQIPLAQRIYRNILASPDATALPEFRLTDVGGPNVSRVFVRPSGARLNEGIPGIYTYQGFYQVFIIEALKASSGALGDAFIYGQWGEPGADGQSIEFILSDVFDFYYDDYITAYDTLLGDIDILPLQSLSQTVEVTNILSSPTSPILNILQAVAQQTRLADNPEVPVDADDVGWLKQLIVGNAILDNFNEARQHPAFDSAVTSGLPVEAHFAWLQDLVTVTRNEGSQIDAFVSQLEDVYRTLNRMSFTGEGSPILAMTQFRQSAENYGDTPLNRWVRQISGGATQASGQSTRVRLNTIWQSEVLPLCIAATAFNYPFQRDSASDTPIDDFNTLFAPGGLIDDFFNTNLADLVDRSSGDWIQRPGTLDDYVISATVLRQMQNATKIQNAFFANGGSRAVIDFAVTPEALDPTASEMRLEIGGSRAFFTHDDPIETTPMRWTGATSDPYMLFLPDGTKGPSEIGFFGPWALFRLFDAAEIRDTNAVDRHRLIFSIGGRIGIYTLHTTTFDNPFTLPALSDFECPQSL